MANKSDCCYAPFSSPRAQRGGRLNDSLPLALELYTLSFSIRTKFTRVSEIVKRAYYYPSVSSYFIPCCIFIAYYKFQLYLHHRDIRWYYHLSFYWSLRLKIPFKFMKYRKLPQGTTKFRKICDMIFFIG